MIKSVSLFLAIGVMTGLFGLPLSNAAREPSAALSVKNAKVPVTITADSSTRDSELEIIELEGNVQIMFGESQLKCDRAVISLRNKMIDAFGSVVYTSPEVTAGGERMLIEYETKKGVIYDGYVKSGNLLFEGGYIIKSSETDYLSADGQFTTCSQCPEPWAFTGSKVRAELGGYAYIKNALLKLGGFPVFWLPYLVVPLKSDRQTGLLTPEFERSESGGLAVSQSFFYVISPSEDVTLTLKNYELRGLMGAAHFQYLLSPSSYGGINAATISDRVFASDDRLDRFRGVQDEGSRINRWFLDYSHIHSLPDKFTHRLQIANMSDLQYSSDFLTRQRGESAIESRMSVSKSYSSDLVFVDSAYYLNLLQANPIASNNDAVHRIPEINYARRSSPLGVGGLSYSWNFNFSNFARTEFAWDDMSAPYTKGGDRHLNATGPNPECSGPRWWDYPECSVLRDGEFDPNQDIIRTGQRLDFSGMIDRSFTLSDSFDLVPRIQLRETQYRFYLNENSTNVRRYMRAELKLRTAFNGIFGGADFEDKSGKVFTTSYMHEIFPEFTFTQIPWIDHPSHPFFGAQPEAPFLAQRTVADGDINAPYGVQFDFNDRIFDRKLLNFAITNKLVRKRRKVGADASDRGDYNQLLYWKISQSYDFYQQERNLDPKQPLSDVSSEIRLNLDPFYIYQQFRYSPYFNVFDTDSRLRYTARNMDFFEVQHVLSHERRFESRSDRSSEDYVFILGKSSKYIDFLGRTTVNAIPNSTPGKLPIKSLGYGVQFKLPGECWNFTFVQISPIGGDTILRMNFNFAWSGKPVPVLPEHLLSGYNL